MAELFGSIPSYWVELAGYLACGLVFLTFCMKTLIPLRILAIASNVVFILYAIGAHLTPVLLLHAALLPLNLWRTAQVIQKYRRIRTVNKKSAEVETLLPFMLERLGPKGEVLFRKGDLAQEVYYINSGTVRVPEFEKTLVAGELFGEIGLFTPDRTRTASAVCNEDCALLVITDKDIMRHCLDEPSFGLFLTKLIAARMVENQCEQDADQMRRISSRSEVPPLRRRFPEPLPEFAPSGASEHRPRETG